MTDMVRVTLGGESREVERERWTEVADELVAKYGGGVPDVTPIGAPSDGVTSDEVAAAINAAPEGARAEVRGPGVVITAERPIGITSRKPGAGMRIGSPLEVAPGKLDLIGQARSTLDAEATAAAGFAVEPPIFDRGTRVDETGVRNARRARQEWEAMPTVLANCEAHAARIQAEEREDSVAMASGVAMQDDGTLLVRHVDDPPGAAPTRYSLTEPAFGALVTRLGLPAAGRYLRQCWPELRATNVNGWVERLTATEAKALAAAKAAARASDYTPVDLRLRHRLTSRAAGAGPEREIFGIVSPEYAAFDADMLDEAIALAIPKEARGRVTYDGRRTRWEILFHTTLQPEHFVAGEFFRAGVIVGTDDTGGGAIRGNAVVWQNLCLNLIVVQTTTTAEFSIRHQGDVDALARKFRAGFSKAMGAIDHFVRAWDKAVETDEASAVRRVSAAAGRALPADGRELMAGIFRDAIERELVPVRVRSAQREDAVRGLLHAWEQDSSAAAGPTRAAVVNAFTRWAHEGVELDPWREDEVQAGAGALLRRTKRGDGWAVPLGFQAPEDVR